MRRALRYGWLTFQLYWTLIWTDDFEKAEALERRMKYLREEK